MGKVSLRELKDKVDVVDYIQFEKRLGSTIINKYSSEIEGYFLKILSGNGRISIPTMQKFIELNPSYEEDMINLYKEKMCSEDISCVDVDTMVSQASLFDSLCFVYDSVKDVYTLATMNFELLYDLNVEYDMLSQVATKNRSGLIKAYRIDVEYNNSDREFTFKAVNARDYDIDDSKPDGSEGKRFYLVPYAYIASFMKIIDGILNKGVTIRIHQALMGIEKVRVISKDLELLSSMCDTPDAVKGVSAKYFPLKGFFYAPVVGAPSTSAMVTNINIFDICLMKKATDTDFKRFNIHKPENPIKELIGESLVINKLICIKMADEVDFMSIIDRLPYRKKFLSPNIDDITKVSLSKYMHSLSESAIDKVYSIVDVNDELNKRLSLFNDGRSISGGELLNIDGLLSQRVCRIIIQKKDCKLSSILCTNNKDILRCIYGDDYIRKYEGFSTRFYILLNWIRYKYENGWSASNDSDLFSLKSELVYTGFESEDVLNEIIAKINMYDEWVSSEEFEEDLKSYLADTFGINLRRSDSKSYSGESDKILSRTLTAYLDSEGNPVDFYKYIDKSKIIACIVF